MPFPNPWLNKLPASLIRRLGEAADGFRGKGEAYFVVTIMPDADGYHAVSGPYRKESDVSKAIEGELAAGSAGWFGPILTPLSKTPPCPIREFNVSTCLGGVTIPRERFDCLFYSISAVEKFAIPYYARMYGGDYVKELHRKFEASDLQLMGHLPGTEYDFVKKGRRATPAAAQHSPNIAGVVTGVDGAGNAIVEEIIPRKAGQPSPDSL